MTVLAQDRSPEAGSDESSSTAAPDTATPGDAATEANEPDFAPGIIDLTITVPRSESDRLLEQDCDEEAEAARIANEIIVCRRRGEATDGSWDKERWERDYAARTKGATNPDVAGGGIFRGKPTVSSLCVIPPCPAEAAIMIDVEALPEAPPGSDADRIARGLPPLGEDDELSPEEIARRRRALGLDAPPVPDPDPAP